MNPTPTPTCRHLHTDGRPCGSPALRNEPFCFHHHTARKPMPKRSSPEHPFAAPQLPAPDDFPAIQRAVGEVLRLLALDRLSDPRAQTLLKGLAIASQNLARHHRREEKLAALGLLPPAVTEYVNDPQHGTLALDPNAIPEDAGCPASEETGCPTFATVSSSLRWDSTAPVPDPLPPPIPLLTPDPSPQTSYDEGKTIEINHYFQTIDDKRRERSREFLAQREAALEQELEARYDDRLNEFKADQEARFQTRLEAEVQAELEARRQTIIPIPIPQNQDLSPKYENNFALTS